MKMSRQAIDCDRIY